jgi:hypothetical protein
MKTKQIADTCKLGLSKIEDIKCSANEFISVNVF